MSCANKTYTTHTHLTELSATFIWQLFSFCGMCIEMSLDATLLACIKLFAVIQTILATLFLFTTKAP